ncbi:MAG TPA: hypothetical protein VL326_01120 [Kofleriaceae bacterium]|nr:hypothetical protein [Kofleriaceae bacterium]
MERRIDLDAAARELELRAERARASGITVDAITWRDQADRPPTLKTVREEVSDPDSIGVRCVKGDQEGRLVLFRGAWADLEYWSGDVSTEPLVEAPGADDGLTLESYAALLDRFFELFRDSSSDRTAQPRA